ncbi:MAG: hypothetical protein RL375_2223 [Pseudomonadota bacterium]
MNLDARPRWRWLSRAYYAYFAVWLSVWLDRTALAVLSGGLIGAGALLAATAPDLRGMREAAEAAPLTISVPGGPASSAAGVGGRTDFSAREPAGGRLAVAVVDLDQTPLSRQTLRLLGASASLRTVDVGSDLGRGHDLLRQGQVLALLLLPERLQEGWLAQGHTDLRAAGGGTDRLDRAAPTRAEGAESAAAPALPGPAAIELYGGAGPLGRQRALLAALDEVLHALPLPIRPTAPGTAVPTTEAGHLGLVVMGASAGLQTSPAGTSTTGVPGRPGAAAGSGAGTASIGGLGGGSGEAGVDRRVPGRLAMRATVDVRYGDAPLLSSGWLPALLALPAVRPATALLMVQQTLLVVMCMLFAHWSEHRGWPVRRNWNSYLGVWAALLSLAVLGCLFHLVPGRLSGWFDPAVGTRYGALLVLLLLYCASLAALSIWLAGLLRYREGGLIGLALLTLPLLALAVLPAPLPWGWPDSPGAVLPAAMQALAWLLPSTAAGHSLALLTEAGAGWADCTPDFIVLGAIGVAALAGGLHSWREPLIHP